MGIASVRSAFLAAARGRLRLDHAGLSYQDSHQVLLFTGWHVDGAPFAMVTAPFDHDPVLRAAQVARDIIAAYVGRPAAAPINQLRIVGERPARRQRALLERRAEPYARLVRAVAGVRTPSGRFEAPDRETATV